MYDISKISERLAELRRENKMTQDEVAKKLDITPQAVSKWEHGTAFPDITILPKVAEVYGVSIDELFGKKPETTAETEYVKYPKVKNGLNLIKTNEDVALYADVEAVRINGNHIEFSDGSEADLDTNEIVNKSGAKIEFEYFDEAKEKSIEKQIEQSFENIDSMQIEVGGCSNVLVKEGKSSDTHVKVVGDQNYIKRMSMNAENGKLTIIMEPSKNVFGYSNDKKFTIEITTGFSKGKEVYFKSSGASDIKSEVDFEKSMVSVSGAGRFEGRDMGDIEIGSSGSGTIAISKCASLKATGSGASSITVKEISGNLECSFSGASNIELGKGNMESFKLSVSGAGDCDARNVTTIDSDVRLSGAGKVTIGRVIGVSREKIGKGAKLHILQRG